MMMKKLISLLLCVLLVLSLTACREKNAAWEPRTLADELLSSGAYSASLNELSASKAVVYYELDGDAVEDAIMYHASGTNQEQLAIFTAKDEAAAKAILTELQAKLKSWAQTEANYAPAEVDKLNKAILRQNGKLVLLAVCADSKAAEKAIG